MKKVSEIQGSSRTFAEYLSPKTKGMDLEFNQDSPHFKSYAQETPMKPSQVPNLLSHPPPRRALPLLTPEQTNKDRDSPQLHPTHSGCAPNNSAIYDSLVNSLVKDRVGPNKHFVQLAFGSPTNSGQAGYSPQATTKERPGPTHFSSSHILQASQTNNYTSKDRPADSFIFHKTSSQLMKNLNHTPSHNFLRDQGTESKVMPYNSGCSNATSERPELNKCQQEEPERTPSAAKIMLHQERNLYCTPEKRHTELEHSDEISMKPCAQGANPGKTQTNKPVPNISPVPSSKDSSVWELSPKTTDSLLLLELACGQSTHSEISSTIKSTQSPGALLSKHCDKRVPSVGTKQAYVDFSHKNVVRLSALSKSSEESVKKRNEENLKRDKSSNSSTHQKDSSRSPFVSISPSCGLTSSSTPVLPAKAPSRGNQSEESRKSHSCASKLMSKSNSGSTNVRTVERNKANRARRPIPDDIDDLFTPDPMTYVVSPARKAAKLKIEGEEIKSPTLEKYSTPAPSSSTPVSGLCISKTPQSTPKESPNVAASSTPYSPSHSPALKPEKSKLSSKDKALRNHPVTSSGKQLKEESVRPEENCKHPLSSSSPPLEAVPAKSGQTSSVHGAHPNEGSRKDMNEEDPVDVELDLGLSIAYDVDLTQSSDSSEEEQLISLKEMMERVTKPPDTPEKEAFPEPSTPVQRRCQSKAHLPLATKSSFYKNTLDQMLKEINNNKKAKEVERQLLTTCQEDLLKIAEYEQAEENREEEISSEQQEFLQRYSLMSSAIREVPPGEVVFNLERFGRIFDQDTLQLRQCLVSPQWTSQKTLLWSSPAQLRLHLNIGLFQEAYDCSSPCPAQVTRFLFKMMSVHSERMVSEKILQALCDIACSAAYQIVKNESQQFEVWVPSLADVTLVLLNMGVEFVTLFPFKSLQPPFTEGDLLESVYVKEEGQSSKKEQPIFPEHNCSNILKYLSYCMGLCPRAYSDNELLLLLIVVGRISMDVNRIPMSSIDVTCLQHKMINNIRDWSTMLPRICQALTNLTDDHHNMCLVVQLLPDSTHGKELRRHLSLSMISKLLNGNCTYKPSQDEFQLADLRPYLPRMQPSALFRGLLQKNKDQDMSTLDQQAYYLCYSLLTLTNEASNFQLFPAHQKEQLLFLSSELETHVKCDIRESEKCLYRSKVKDLLARMYTKWQMLLQRTRPLYDKLYDYWQPVDTFKSNRDDEENPLTDEEEEETTLTDETEDDDGMVAEDEEREEVMEVNERIGGTEGDVTENDTSKTEEAVEPVTENDSSPGMREMLPKAVDEQMDTNDTECTSVENENDSEGMTTLLASGYPVS
ncbi:SMC5-SMC6 complex localization factor protein 2 [Menidia menidia]